MSYDLHFVPTAAGVDPEAVHAFLEAADGNPTTPAKASQDELAESLLRLNPALEPFKFDFEEIARIEGVSVEDARRSHCHVELNASEESGIQITLFTQHAWITVPYWHTGAAAEKVFTEVRAYADVLTERGSYRIFDPQTERVVDDFEALEDALLRAYAGVAGAMPDLASEATQPKPWWRFW